MGERKMPSEPTPFAGEMAAEGTRELSHPDRVARLGHLKKRAVEIAGYLSGFDNNPLAERFAGRLRGCANWLLFHHYVTIAEVRLAKVHTCQLHLLCPFCARARAMKTLGAYLERFQVIQAGQPPLRLAMLTLTVKNGDDLAERFEHLRRSWKIYCDRRRDALKKQRGFNELSKVEGAIFSYEFTKGKDGWHPHIHAVVVLRDWIDQAKLADEWEGITGDSRIVDIRRIKGDPVEGFAEVCKYALKFADLDSADTYHAFQVLKGRRLQGSFGSFRGVVVPEKATDDLLDLPYLELKYRYRHGAGYSLAGAPIKRGDIS